ncbi:MAG: hypothetical protein ABI026_06195 [Gemmatimonadaceae bacterium]
MNPIRKILRFTAARNALLISAATAITAVAASAQSVTPVTLDDFLRPTVGLGSSEMAQARSGKVAVKLLQTGMNRDVAVFGIVGIHTTRDAYMAHLRDMRALISAHAERSGVMSDPPQPADVAAFSFDESEWGDLRSCRVNDCDFKMSASLMQQFAQSVHWGNSDARYQVDSVMRTAMLDMVTAYTIHGNAAMPRYDDTHGVQAGDAFRALLAQSSFLGNFAPVFYNYLINYPAGQLPGALDVIYWSVEKIPHLRPTLMLSQLVEYTPASGTPLLVRKQIYANHYFEASFEVLAVFDAPDLAGGPGIYVVAVRRYRFDSLPGGFLNIRGRARSQLQKLLQSDLERERSTAEAKP